jgi:AraC-like DNA-binding protein
MKHILSQIIVPDCSSFSIKKTKLTPATYNIHSHKNFEINYIVNGMGTRIIGDNIETFYSGDLVILGPELPHCWEVKSVSDGFFPECITIHFHEHFLEQQIMKSPELLPIYDLIKESCLGIEFFGEEKTNIANVLHKMLKANPLRRLIYLLEIFEILIRTHDRKVLAKAGFLNDSINTHNQKLNKVYEYIMVNFTKKIYLKDVSSICCMSPSTFCRFFENVTGKTLFDYLKEVRIGYACKLLQESELTISNICYQSGFNNLSHFNNQFKDINHVSPGEYRKMINKVSN